MKKIGSSKIRSLKIRLSPECESELLDGDGVVSPAEIERHFKSCKYCQRVEREDGPRLDRIEKEMAEAMRSLLAEAKGPPKVPGTEIKVGDKVNRHIGPLGSGADMVLKVTAIDDRLIHCGDWAFLKATGGEVDEDLGWDGYNTGSGQDHRHLPEAQDANGRDLPVERRRLDVHYCLAVRGLQSCNWSRPKHHLRNLRKAHQFAG